MIRKRRFSKEKIVRVTFSLPPEAAEEEAFVMGDFNEWQMSHPMKTQKDGTWRVTIPLEPGREYAFRYLVDRERWLNENDADRHERNPFGEDNSVIVT